MEELFSHNQIKTALGITLGGLIEEDDLGLYVTDGMLLVNADADLATWPDAIFVSHAIVQRKGVEFVAGRRKEAVATRIVGSPDLVVEIVSQSSEAVDTEWLMSAYHDAGIVEYWVIDARGDEPEFVIYQRRAKEFVAVRKSGGWTKSPILGKSFRLRRTMVGNYPRFKLEIR